MQRIQMWKGNSEQSKFLLLTGSIRTRCRVEGTMTRIPALPTRFPPVVTLYSVEAVKIRDDIRHQQTPTDWRVLAVNTQQLVRPVNESQHLIHVSCCRMNVWLSIRILEQHNYTGAIASEAIEASTMTDGARRRLRRYG